jgi:sortase family protein
MAGKRSRDGGGRGLMAAVAAAFILGGTGLVVMWAASQDRAPQPSKAGLSAAATGRQPELHGATPATRPSGGRFRTTLPRSLPVAVDIPSIDVHSTLQSVGQAADGSLEVPEPGPHYDEAAWYKHSPTPGSLGPSVLLGHVDSALNGPSVFFRLGELRPGDRISVTREDASIAVFSVDEVRRYAKDDFPTALVYGDIDHAGLRMLTCGGAFDESTGHYLDNIVVFASLDSARG